MIQNGFNYREEFNRIYMRLQSTGIVQRANKKYRAKILKKNHNAKDNYQVEIEGVLFEHVQLLAIEIIFKWNSMRVVTKIEPNVEAFERVGGSIKLNFQEV